MPDDAPAAVIVVGAGVAGLVTALDLARRGIRPLVLEAAPEPGGCVRSHPVGGLRLDRGADSFATARPSVADLAASLGLPVQRPAGGAAWVRYEGGAAPLPTGALLGIPSRPWAGDVRRIIGASGALRAIGDGLLPVGIGAGAGLGELVHRRMGDRVLRRLVEPVVGGVYSADPAGLDVDTVAPGLRSALASAGSLAGAVTSIRGSAPPAGSAVAGLVGGMGRLTEALVTALHAAGGELRCGVAVRSVVRSRARDGARWAVTVDSGSRPARGEELAAPQVVLATPAAVTARLLGAATDGALALPVAPVTAVVLATLVLDEPALDAAPRGTGVLVARRVAGVAAKALTHATAKWPYLAGQAGAGRHVLRLSYGRGGSVPLESAFPDLALADASDLLGVRLDRRRLVDHALVHYPDQLAAPRSGRAAEIAHLRQELTRWPGLSVTGAGVAGTGLAAVVADATATADAAASEH